jgi:hypothetical protein
MLRTLSRKTGKKTTTPQQCRVSLFISAVLPLLPIFPVSRTGHGEKIGKFLLEILLKSGNLTVVSFVEEANHRRRFCLFEFHRRFLNEFTRQCGSEHQ